MQCVSGSGILSISSLFLSFYGIILSYYSLKIGLLLRDVEPLVCVQVIKVLHILVGNRVAALVLGVAPPASRLDLDSTQ